MIFNSKDVEIRNRTPFILIALLSFIIYSNTLNGEWQFDDHPNILMNPNLQVVQLSYESFFQSLFVPFGNGDRLRRPIAHLTFAANWFFNQEDVTGYHVVNIIIHILNSFFLFGTILLLFRSPKLYSLYSNPGLIYFVALLSTVLWAIHPIQTQAVTYIVQRMASLATLFYIIGIFFYLRGRLWKGWYSRVINFSLCFISYCLAIGSKENAVILPLALITVEIIFFFDFSDKRKRKNLLFGLGLTFIISLIGTLIIWNAFLQRDLSSLLRGYESRSFTLTERLLTQPRVLVFYFFQIFYPNSGNLSLMHYFPISTSLIAPWTTPIAILLILFLLTIGFVTANKWPTISFAILFYFLNHVVESSFIPLEMVYEHRNYLPSLFLFLPIAIGIWKLLDYLHPRVLIRYVSIAAVVLLVFILGMITYFRNEAWATESSLWTDTLLKAPELARPAHNLGEIYSKAGRYGEAMALFEKALTAIDMRIDQKALTYNSMGNVYYQIGQWEKSTDFYLRSIDENPRYEVAWYNLTLAWVKMGKWNKALKSINQLFAYNPSSREYLTLKGAILLKSGKIETAIEVFKKALKINPFHKQTRFYLGVAYHISREYRKAFRVLNKSSADSPEKIQIVFWMIETANRLTDPNAVEHTFTMLFDRFSINRIYGGLSVSEDPFLPDLIKSISFKTRLQERLLQKIRNIGETGSGAENNVQGE